MRLSITRRSACRRRSPSPRRRRPVPAAVLATLAVVAALASCATVATPGDTAGVEVLEVRTVGGYRFTQYVNRAYPCSVSGHQTFTVVERSGTEAEEPAPLFVHMRGGGVGWFSTTGQPRPSAGKMTQQSLDFDISALTDDGITGAVRDSDRGFRGLVVSMCSHDIYAGTNTRDPHNPDPDRPTNGLLATKAAIRWTLGHYSTPDYIIRGGSAGSVGSLHVAWGIEAEGMQPPAGIIADSGVLNEAFEEARATQLPTCNPGERDAEALPLIKARLSPQVTAPENHPEKLVADGRLTVPILHAWNQGDRVACGQVPIECPVGDDVVTLGAADCLHEPLRRAIEADDGLSVNLRVCVEGPAPEPCDAHGVTNRADAPYVPAIYDWVLARLDS